MKFSLLTLLISVSLYASQLVERIIKVSDEFNLDPRILIAQAYTESSLKPEAINTKEKNGIWSRGLFQIQGPTGWEHCKLTEKQLMNPYWNTKCAAIIHKNNKEKFGDDAFADIKMLFAYNAGGYYICKNIHNKKCKKGYPVNFSYLAKTVSNYMYLLPLFEKYNLNTNKSVNFLHLTGKYVDTLISLQ